MLYKYELSTLKNYLYSITDKVKDAINKSGIKSGVAVIYCPHTTAGITINESYDPDVVTDMMFALEKAFPDRSEFLHAEGNSDAHLKASYVGASETVIVENGKLLLGRWQGIYFCEFDAPRNRKFFVKVI